MLHMEIIEKAAEQSRNNYTDSQIRYVTNRETW